MSIWLYNLITANIIRSYVLIIVDNIQLHSYIRMYSSYSVTSVSLSIYVYVAISVQNNYFTLLVHNGQLMRDLIGHLKY